MSDYYNLLSDTLRSSHLQVEKIYQALLTKNPNHFINIRTGFAMYERRNDENFVYSYGNYSICWNFPKISTKFNPQDIKKLLKKYEEWLRDYETNFDNQRIKKLIENELEIAKEESKKNNYNHNYYTKYENESKSEEEEDLEGFIVDDQDENEDEEIDEEEDLESLMEIDEEINNLYDHNSKYKRSGKKLKKMNQNNIQFNYEDFDDDQTPHKSNNKNINNIGSIKKKIIIDDEEEIIVPSIIKHNKIIDDDYPIDTMNETYENINTIHENTTRTLRSSNIINVQPKITRFLNKK